MTSHPTPRIQARHIKRLAIELLPDDWAILSQLQRNLSPTFGRLSQASIVRYALRKLADATPSAPVDHADGPPVVARAGPGS